MNNDFKSINHFRQLAIATNLHLFNNNNNNYIGTRQIVFDNTISNTIDLTAF